MSTHAQYDRARAIDRPPQYALYDRRCRVSVWLPLACEELRAKNAVCWCGRPNGHQGRHRRTTA